MGLLFFIIGLILFSLLICFTLTHSKVENKPLETNCEIKSGAKLRRKFKDSYLWACDTFGVSVNVYEELEDNMIRWSLGEDYFTLYYTSYYGEYYPRIQRCKNRISDHRSSKQMELFANEFINVVESMRNIIDSQELELFKKYGISYKNLLTQTFQVDNMKLYSLPS